MEELDIATGLELLLSDEQEQKFLAFKTLQAKKVKSLMISVDNKEKEISKLKFLGKDNRRTQMIQSLKNKLRDFELVIDFLKDDLMKKNEFTKEELNEYVIKKTISGPKRFRPMTREELENKIADLERQLNIIQSKQRSSSSSSSSNSINKSISNPSIAPGKPLLRNNSDAKAQLKSILQHDDTSSGSGNGPMSNFLELVSEIELLKATLEQKSVIITTQKDELLTLRQRCNELSVHDDSFEQFKNEYHEMKQNHDMLVNEYDVMSKKLSHALEDNIQSKIELSLTLEDSQQETQQLHLELQRVLQQNNSLVEQLTKAEIELDSHIGSTNAIISSTSKISTALSEIQTSSSSSSSSSGMKALETKVIKVNEKCKFLEEKCSNLTSQLKQIDELKDTLREKNSLIRDLTRSYEDEKKKNSRNITTTSPNNTSDNMKLASLLDENRKLKQALAIATSNQSTSSQPRSVGSSSSTSSELKMMDAVTDTLLLTGNGLVSIHNQFHENILQRVLDSSMPTVATLHQQVERYMKAEHSSEQGMDSKKLETILRMCSKLEGTSELNVS